MIGKHATRASKAAKVWLLAVVLVCATAGAAPSLAFADTGGSTELVVQGAADAEPEESASSDAQTRSVVTNGQKGGEGTPQTGDPTPIVPVAIVVTGACLVAVGRAVRTRREETFPVIPRKANAASGDAGSGRTA